jgi:UDP-N-acetylmuramoylalanine--D-glutamate ligase
MSYISELTRKKILVVGGGTTGKSLIRFLSEQKIDFRVIDEKIRDIPGVQIHSEVPSDFQPNLAIVSPGWKPEHPLFAQLRAQDVEVIGELDFAWLLKEELNPDQRWVAVTGTNGKTTTVQMLESIILSSKLKAIACGNVGLPVIEAVTDPSKYQILALELSSFQIAWSQIARYEAVAILNIAEDHIDWHGSFANYSAAKIKLLEMSQCAILNLADPEIILQSINWTGRKIFFSLDTPQAGELGLVEEILVDRAFVVQVDSAEVIADLSDISPTVPHNIANALAAAGIALALGIAHPDIKIGLSNFKLDHHRLEVIANYKEVSWVNDSKATNPHAASAALLSHLSNIWIAGGLAKGARMEDLVKRCAPRIKAAILIGTDRELIANALANFAPQVEIFRVDMDKGAVELMDSVVKCAQKIAKPGDTVLLAPACASMDQFKSYAERGEYFASSVRKLVR